MRVTTGSARGRNLSSLPGLDTRPTSSKMKEGMMSAIQFDLPQANVLDLFAGTGQLGIEALSRGAKGCIFVENSRAANDVIVKNLRHTELFSLARTYNTDVFSWLARTTERFDVVFIDPPYHQHLIPKVLALLADKMNDHGVIVCEADADDVLPETVGTYSLAKTYPYGKRKFILYRQPQEV